MTNSARPLYLLTAVFLSVGLVLTGCGGNGDDNENDNGNGDGSTAGLLAGTVTNDLTGGAIANAGVGLDPPVDGVEIATGEDGTYSQELPAGVYTLTFEADNYVAQSAAVSVNAGGSTPASAALEPVAAVVVTAAVAGDAEPGASLMATAMVEVLDGMATIQGYSWTQANSVDVTIQNPSAESTGVLLPDEAAYKDELIHVLLEPPISEDQLPPNVPVPPEGAEFPGGLQDRWQVVGMSPFSLEEAALVTLMVTVETSSGTFSDEVEIHAHLPWVPSLGIRDVPVGVPVLLYGKTQDSYDWELSSAPPGAGAGLVDADTQSPWFEPDQSGRYTFTVTDTTALPNEEVTLDVYVGTWAGAITGQDADGNPEAAGCTVCHNGTIAGDTFTPWAETGHAHIFSDNLNFNDHYGPNCFVCHTVGYDPAADNGGIDDADDYQDFLDSGLIESNSPDNWTTMLADYPDSARLANIQCENCHGPQNDAAHTMGEPRASLASEVCAVCHGEPLRHRRYQQWQLSGHANYELAIDESQSGSCSRCHTANGFLAWLPVLLDDDPETSPLDDVEVTWTSDEAHPQTCVTCHDPHSIGSTTGVDTDATVRISGNTPLLTAGFTVFGAGKGALCMTCHNSRRGLRNDETFDATTAAGDASRAPHGSSQTDVIMGQNAYFVNTGIRGNHSLVTDSCVDCHMDQTPPPDVLSYNLGGTNHTFFAAETICMNCHEEIEADSVEDAFQASSDELKQLIEARFLILFASLTEEGNSIDLNGLRTITEVSEIQDIEFGETRGRQALTVTFADDEVVGPSRMNDIHVLGELGVDLGELYDFADERLIKAGWNWNLANNDGSKAIHNPSFVFEVLDFSIDEMVVLLDE